MPNSNSRRKISKTDGVEVIVYDRVASRRHLVLPEDGLNHARLLGRSVHDTVPITYRAEKDKRPLELGCQIARIIPADEIEERKLTTPHISLTRIEAGEFELQRTERRRTKQLVERMPAFRRQSFTATAV